MSEKQDSPKLFPLLSTTFGTVLSPAKVKKIVITSASPTLVRGFLEIWCPVENQLAGKDFEVGFKGTEQRKVKYVMVDGRRLFAGVAGRRVMPRPKSHQ